MRADSEKRKENASVIRMKKKNYFISDGEKEHGEAQMSELES
jgi:hypothetical protein